ncbi:MAG: glycosyltransferase family 4 protein [Oscillatoriales cyanobacterium RM2_1_1]|nr:glycosyltransferase family 4 protein [Oscillatoriales cyanobacterium SM2_3_0]NJO46144.1 glycosyltransferase family 4 protein [Oscillatoriales cyanobacterium RM2_1_1]
MHVVIIFKHLGHYHIARLNAAYQACIENGWTFTAIQVTDQTQDHPWGDLKQAITFPLETLLPAATTPDHIDRRPDSSTAAAVLPVCLDKIKPDILVIPGWGFPISRAALHWSKQHKIPAILMSESKWDDEPRTWWKELLKSWLYVQKFDAALVGGNLHREYLIRLGFSRERIFLGYDVVDNDYFFEQAKTARKSPNEARQRCPQMPPRPYFLATTRLIPRKNILRLVQAYGSYFEQMGEQSWDLVICGSGVEQSQIEQTIQLYQLGDRIHLPGFVTYQQIGDWYGLANALIHPALQEQWGLVVNEACAAGLPILGSKTVGACYELVQPHKNGFLFDPESSSEITESLLKIHRLDGNSRLEMGQISQKIVDQFHPRVFAQGLLQAIHTAL